MTFFENFLNYVFAQIFLLDSHGIELRQISAKRQQITGSLFSKMKALWLTKAQVMFD